LPEHALPTASQVSPTIELHQPPSGGHVGFMSGPLPGRIDWLPQRLCGYFDSHLSAQPSLVPDAGSQHG